MKKENSNIKSFLMPVELREMLENNRKDNYRYKYLLALHWANIAMGHRGRNYLKRLTAREETNEEDSHVLPLVIDLSKTLDFTGNLIITPWSQGIIWSSDVSGSVESYGYLEQEIAPLNFILYQGNDEQERCSQWYLTIPKEIRVRMVLFDTHQFTILYLASHYKHAYELFVSQPILFWLMLCTAKEQNVPEHKLLLLMGKSRKEILLFCGLPATKSALKVISKLRFFKYNSKALAEIRLLFKTDNYSGLNHLERIGRIASPLINDFPELLKSRLLQGVCKENSDYTIARIIRDTQLMAETLEINNVMERVKNCDSFDAVHALHDYLVRRLNNPNLHPNFDEEMPDVKYQTPPLEGNSFIFPITDAKGLYEEGRVQNHCVYSYHADIVSGDYYVYKIISPQRATLGLFLYPDGEVELDQLYLADNSPVSSTTQKFVLEWISMQELTQKV